MLCRDDGGAPRAMARLSAWVRVRARSSRMLGERSIRPIMDAPTNTTSPLIQSSRRPCEGVSAERWRRDRDAGLLERVRESSSRVLPMLALAVVGGMRPQGACAAGFSDPTVGLQAAAPDAATDATSPVAPPTPPASAAPPTGDRPASGDGLADAALDADLLDFRMRVPIGTEVRVERGERPSYLLAETGDAPAWRMRFAPLRASRVGTSAATQVAGYLAELRGKGEAFEVLLDEARTISGAEARLYFIAVPLEGGGRGISGGLVVPHGDGRFLVASILVLDGEYGRVRPLLERSLATIELVDRSDELNARAELLGRGQAIADAITPDRLRAAADGTALVYRMWRPEAQDGRVDGRDGGRKDFGYMVVRAREGAIGELDPSRDPASLKGEETLRGLLATVDARVIVNDDPTHTYDVQSRYFVSFDRATESWSTRSTERHRRASRSSAQTGLRIPGVGRPDPPLQVITATIDGRTGEPKEWPVPPAYLSQAELVVLGTLLPRGERVTEVEFLDYAFDPKSERLPQRREKWSRAGEGWRLETRLGNAPEVLVQEFDAAGARVRRVDPDGTVTERIGLEELRALWKSKGLPVD